MKKLALCMALVLGFAVVAQAQCETDKLLEKVLILQFAEEAGVDAYDMADLLSGYAEYRTAMDSLEKAQADAKAALEAAIAAGNSSDISAKMNALMEADKALFDAKQEAVSQASALLSTADVAKLYLIVSDLPAAKKALVASLSPKCCPMMAAAAPAAAAAAPCAAAPAAVAEAPAATPEEEVMATVKEIVATILAGDADKLLGFVSEDFEHPEVGDKEAVKDYVEMGKEMGYLDDFPTWVKENDGEISIEDAEVEIKDGEATVYPIDASASMGAVSVELVLKKDADGKWRVITGDADGI